MPPEKRSIVITFLNTIGGVSGLLSIAILVFWGGAWIEKVSAHEKWIGEANRIGLVEKVMANDGRLTKVENSGTTDMQKHKAQDDDRDMMQNDRLEKLEAAISKLGTIEMKLDKVLERVIIGK
jgi:hypothetical protein